ncbi:hypothetical protein HH310_08135 [Actinoplanes sp. TBRC 11911]|uniref:hypothetical protein n=1 Tax=Actinoplanes sp. TBRC 11911 TaxID=2729386 RepID=UPI00145E511A|nr:hypothetical protein [Actinoplanes sp. TBRC 11911]NMO51155.1 hypothetical protein [Actinoplanes sp. TBRC 11911]
MANGVRIPAAYVSTGWGTPTVCVRHGLPAAGHKPARFISRVPGWAYPLVLAGGVVFLIVVRAVQKEVRAARWPFCPRCSRDRMSRMVIGIVLAVAGVAGIPIALSASDGSVADGTAGPGVSLLLLIVLIMVGYIVAVRATWSSVAGGITISKGQEVDFPRAHEAFVAEAVAARESAARYYAAQQQAYADVPPQAYAGVPPQAYAGLPPQA